jgi:ACS family glucarate transporter-like MFS transporter
VLAGLCATNLLAYIHRNSIGVAEKDIRSDLHLSEREMGVVMSAFFVTYAGVQIPGGWLGHLWGTRRALTLFTLAEAVATALGSAAWGLGTLVCARLGMGAAQAGMLPCSTNTLSKWFPLTQRGLASGAIGSALSVGGAVGAGLTGLLLPLIAWRWLFVIYALPSLLWAAWFFAWFRDRPEDHAAVSEEEVGLIAANRDVSKVNVCQRPTPWGVLLTSPAMGWICAQQFFRAAGYMFYSTWFATFLRDARGVSLQGAGLLTSLPLMGVVVGSLLGGRVSDSLLRRTGSRRVSRQWLAAASMLLCAAFIVLARPIVEPWLAVALITAGSFCSAFAGPCAYAVTMDMGGGYVAPVFSTMNMAGNLGAVLFPLVVPWLVGEAQNWDLVLLVFAAIHLCAAVCWASLNPNGSILKSSNES